MILELLLYLLSSQQKIYVKSLSHNSLHGYHLSPACKILSHKRDLEVFCGFDYTTFKSIFLVFKPVAKVSSPKCGAKSCRLRRRTLSLEGHLLMTLHYLWTGNSLVSISALFGIHMSLCCKYIRMGINILKNTLYKLPAARIALPTLEEAKRLASIFEQKNTTEIKNVFAMLDGMVIAIKKPRKDQHVYYNGMDSIHGVKMLMMYDVSGAIIWAMSNGYGTMHDTRMLFTSKFMTLIERYKESDLCILADCGLPGGAEYHIVRPHTLTEMRQLVQQDYPFRRLKQQNSAVGQLRVAAEWGNHSFKLFKVLEKPLCAYDWKFRRDILHVCCRLCNIRTRVMHRNQILNVFHVN